MRVLFFAQLKDATGCSECTLDAPEPLSAASLWTALLDRFPGLRVHRSVVRLACNSEYAAPETQFTDPDEVALIPPVSGG